NGDSDKSKVYCYSNSGTGTDCPTQCSGAQCEVIRHPVHNPYGSLGMTASSKNVIAVGATDSLKGIAAFSSRGPTKDGRVKPDLTARGISTYSTLPNNNYGRKNGTSMAAPVVTGVTGLLTEQWRSTFAGASPLAAAMKAVLIAGAEDLGLPGPDFTYGWGFTNAKDAIDLIRADNASGSAIRVAQLTQGQVFEVPITVNAAQNLRVVAVWSDPEVLNLTPIDTSATPLVNDLDLKIIGPSGNTVLPYTLNPNAPTAAATRGVNIVDNVEEVEIANAQPGNYRAILTATHMTGLDPAQQFVLVSRGGAMGSQVATCSDLYEPNNSEGTAFGSLVRNSPITARICSADDFDFYSMTVNGSGPVSVKVTATDTPLRVTILGSGIVPNFVDVAPGETKTVSAQVGSGTGNPVTPVQTVTVRVEATGAIGSTGGYTLTPSYTALTPRARAAKH
ncbi:MAG: type sorting protein, partial [Acidobacteria bacterium]|nr:type sorting protein [Acidobacteriota bacterium]